VRLAATLTTADRCIRKSGYLTKVEAKETLFVSGGREDGENCRTQKNPNLPDLAELALYTGMRQGELLGLTWDRVDRARGVVLLERTKSGRRREVPLNGPADAILARRTPDAR
jgi:integrase